MFAEERRAKILELVTEHGSVRLTQLVDALGVTEPTVRKDLAALEADRLLKRTHGGAISVRAVLEPEIGVREGRNAASKALIARACADLVEDGDAVFLDSGTTIHGVARHLANVRVNVVTNSFAVAQTLAAAPNVRHSVVGGTYRPLSDSFLGPLAVRALGGFTFNTAFIGVGGIDSDGVTTADIAEAEFKAAVIARSRRVVVPADSSKVGATEFALITPLERVDIVVTEKADPYLVDLAQEKGFRIIVATAQPAS